MLVCVRGIREAANMRVKHDTTEPTQEGDGWGALIDIFGDFPEAEA